MYGIVFEILLLSLQTVEYVGCVYKYFLGTSSDAADPEVASTPSASDEVVTRRKKKHKGFRYSVLGD